MDEQAARRVIFCTYPSVYSDVVLTELLDSDKIEVVASVLSTRILHKNYNPLYASWCQIRHSGLRYATYLFSVTGLYQVLRRCLVRPALKQRLQTANIPVLQTKDINNSEGLAFLRAHHADVMLSAHFNQLVGAEILQTQGMHSLNIHPSLLPEYKGVDPAFYALLQNEQQTGVTLHFQEVVFDVGNILQQQVVPVSKDDSLLSLNLKLFKRGAIVAVQQIGEFIADDTGTIQDKQGRYDSWPNAGSVRIFRQRRKLMRWRELSKKLYN